MIILTDRFAAIFWSDRMFEYLKACNLINYDGTFYVVPKLFYQLFTIFIQESHHAIPAIHVNQSVGIVHETRKIVSDKSSTM